MASNFGGDTPLGIDFTSPTILKSDLLTLSQKINTGSTQIYAQPHKPDYKQGKDGDVVSATSINKVFKKSKFPTIPLFPEFTGTIRSVSSYAEWVSAWNLVQDGEIIELTANITLSNNAAITIPANCNILLRSTPGSKFSISYVDTNVTGTETGAYVLTSALFETGFCMKDIIINNFTPTYGGVEKKFLNLQYSASTIAKFHHFFDNVDFIFGKAFMDMSTQWKDLVFTNCLFQNTGFFGTNSTTPRFLQFGGGIRHLIISKCRINCGSSIAPMILAYGSNFTSGKINGDVFLDQIQDISTLPNRIRNVFNIDSFNFVNTIESPIRRVNLYVKDCAFKSCTSAYILLYGNGVSNAPFSQFRDIVLYNNIYQNNEGKGLLSWDWGAPAAANSGVVTGQEYSLYNIAVEKKYAPGWNSLISLSGNLTGENQHIAYNSAFVASGTITSAVLDSWDNASRWVEQPTISSSALTTLTQNVDAATFRFTNLGAPVNSNDSLRLIDVSSFPRVLARGSSSSASTSFIINGFNFTNFSTCTVHITLQVTKGTGVSLNPAFDSVPTWISTLMDATSFYSNCAVADTSSWNVNQSFISNANVNGIALTRLDNGNAISIIIDIHKNVNSRQNFSFKSSYTAEDIAGAMIVGSFGYVGGSANVTNLRIRTLTVLGVPSNIVNYEWKVIGVPT